MRLLGLMLTTVTYAAIVAGLFVMQSSLTEADRGNRSRETEIGRSRIRNVTVEILNDTSIFLFWEVEGEGVPRGSESTKCPVRSYLIRIRAERVRGSRTWKIDGKRRSVTLHDLDAGSTYHVRLLALDCGGKGKPSRWLRIRTQNENNSTSLKGQRPVADSVAPNKPTYMRTRTFSDSVIVSWLPPENESVLVRGYMVGYGEGVPDVNWQYLDSSKTNVTIRNLKPSTQYIVSLRAINNAGKGPVVYDLIYTRDPPASAAAAAASSPSFSPTHLRAKVLSPTTVWLQWTDPSLGRVQQLTDSRYYNVHYHATSPAAGKTSSVVVKAFHVVLYELLPGTRYEFKVRMVKDSQASSFSEIVANWTFEAVPSSPPRDVVVMATNDSTRVTVAWRRPRLPNGNITGFLVLYSPDPNLPDENWQVHSVQGHELTTTVSGLLAKKTYHFKVQGRNSKGYSPMSNPVTFHTNPHPFGESLAGLSSASTVNPFTQTTVEETSRVVQLASTSTNKEHREDTATIKKREEDKQTDNETDSSDSQSQSAVLSEDRPDATEALEPRSPQNPSRTGDGKSRRQPTGTGSQDTLSTSSKPPSLKSFRSIVHHHVTAYVTWPDTLAVGCGNKYDARVTSLSTPSGYLFRFSEQKKAVGEAERFVVRNLTSNFVLLDNLVPDSTYRYQVRYLFGSTRSSWSGKSTFETRYKRPVH